MNQHKEVLKKIRDMGWYGRDYPEALTHAISAIDELEKLKQERNAFQDQAGARKRECFELKQKCEAFEKRASVEEIEKVINNLNSSQADSNELEVIFTSVHEEATAVSKMVIG